MKFITNFVICFNNQKTLPYHKLLLYNINIIIMKICKIISSGLLAALSMVSIQASAGNINDMTARTAASNFLKQHAAASPGSLRAHALADIQLAHAEASSKVTGANDYYAFNITGGGFVIIAGEDRAQQVLGYSDRGSIDFDHLPAPLKDLLDGYKNEIEFLQTYTRDDLIPVVNKSMKASAGVGPLIKTTWGQEMPYYLQCPLYQGEYCVVGCVATAMAQVMNYWQYPTESAAIARFYSSGYGYVNALPATTFDYSLMLDSYCHWDWDNSQLIQDTYTEAQAQEVAKLSRYCGQAAQMQYSPEGSGAYTYQQLSAMKTFGFSNASNVSKGGSWNWGGSSYTTEQWEALLKSDLDAGRPILYSANDPSEGGHAFICDGYNSDGMFHFNFGWYGTCDGWYVSTALNMTHRDGTYLKFNSGHEIVYKVEPPTYFIINAEKLDANNNLLVLGEQLNAVAQNVTIKSSYNTYSMAFSLIDEGGSRIATSDMINVSKNAFVQGSNVEGSITLPTNLASGTYNLQFDYKNSSNALTAVSESQGQLVVVGNLAKFNEGFDVSDVTTVIDYILNDYPTSVQLDVNDVTLLIGHILNATD